MDKVEEKISVEYGCKLIAEFMELKYRWVEYPNPQMNRWEVDKDNYWCAMRYYSSWDWLMPVIKKLNGGRPHSAMLWEDITKALIDCDIERTWLAVVNYIKWFYKK